MSLVTMAIPIVSGKTEAWRRFVDELNGPRRAEFEASRRRMGVRERTFLQQTPMGDLVIVTLEGDDAEHAFQRFVSADDEFTRWFVAQAKDLHGVDLTHAANAPVPERVIDTDSMAQRKAA